MTTVTISLPDKIAKKVDNEAEKHGFASRSEFIRDLLRSHFKDDEKFKLEEFKQVPLEQLRMELAQTGKYSEKFINSLIEGLKKSDIYGG